MTSPSSTMELESMFIAKYGEMPAYFNILLRVNGVDRTGVEVKILQLDRIDNHTKKADQPLAKVEHIFED
jgi:hypothetical protein